MECNIGSLFTPILFVVFFSCAEKNTNTGGQTHVSHKIMDHADSVRYRTSMDRIHALKTSMMDYLETSHPFYTAKEVDQCIDILTGYLDELEQTNSRADGMLAAKSAIFKLNKLNEQCDLQLIETREREQIAELMMAASHGKGYSSKNEDITEAWRAW